MAVLNEIDEFNTTIVGKLDLDSEKFQQHQLDKRYEGNLQKANDELGYLYRIKGTVVQGEKEVEQSVFQQLMSNLAMIMSFLKRGICGKY